MNAIDLKPGMIFQYEGNMYTVINTTYTQQQQRRGYIRCKAKELKTGKNVEHLFRSDVKIQQIYVEEKPLIFLYRDKETFWFMDENTYEQISISENIIGEGKNYLTENLSVTGLFYEGKLLDIKLPIFVELKVEETEPGFKGDTVSAGKKKAKLETGLIISVPLFIKVGDVLKIDTRTNEYITRVNENES